MRMPSGMPLLLALLIFPGLLLVIAVVLLVISGLVSLEKLKASRGYVLIGIFVIAAFLTPPDAISQCIMAVPMYLLYEGGILFARVVMRARAKQEDSSGGSA